MDAEKRVSETEVTGQAYSEVPLPRMIWSPDTGGFANWTRKLISEAPSSMVICAGTSNWTSIFSCSGLLFLQVGTRRRTARKVRTKYTFFII